MTKTISSNLGLNALTSLDGRYQTHTKPLTAYFSEAALIRTRIEIEAYYLIHLSRTGIMRQITKSEEKTLLELPFSLTYKNLMRVKELERITHHDVKAMERGLRELVAGTSLEDVIEYIHFGLTSEDINNIAHRLNLKRARKEVLLPQLQQIVDKLVSLAQTNKALPMLARTHGQPAIPTTLGKEFANFAMRLFTQMLKFQEVKLTGKLNGAVGNYNALKLVAPEVQWIEFSKEFLTDIGLEPNLFTTQINPYEDIIEYFQALQRINGVLLDLGQDMWRYISDGWLVQELRNGEVGSSTMPQKVNPIYFENSEGNIAMANSLLEGMNRKLATSRLQRDLSDSTVLRNMGTALGFGLVSYISTLEGLNRIKPDVKEIHKALNKDWSILTEAVQTILRNAGVTDPYSLIASLSRGKEISGEEWKKWITLLPKDVDDTTKTLLLTLTPETYVGEAIHLTELAVKDIQKKYKSLA